MLRIGTGIGWFTFWVGAATVGGALVGHWTVPDTTFPATALHAFAGYLWVGAAVVFVLGLATMNRVNAAVGTGLLLAALWPVLPGHWDRSAEGPGALRIATANLLMVHPDPQALITDLVAQDADVIVLQEVNPRWAGIIAGAPELAAWEHRIVAPEEGSFGVAILSRVPGAFAIEDLSGVMTARMDLTVNGAPLRIYDVHTLPPRDPLYASHWAEQMAQLAEMAATADLPTVFAGDFNATRHHPSYQTLLAAGLRDAHAQVGWASAKTWPNGLFPVPGLRLDHVLVTDRVDVHRVVHAPANGSDHTPVIVDLSVRPAHGPQRVLSARTPTRASAEAG